MEFEALQKTWQSQPSSFQLTLDSDLLLQEVKRNYQSFTAETSRRDLEEARAGIICGVFLALIGIPLHTWIFWCMVPFCIYAALFFFIDRKILRGKQVKPSESLDSTIRASLQQIEHQIWLVRHIISGGLLPLGLSFAGVVSCMLWQIMRGGSTVIWVWVFVGGVQPVFYVLVLMVVYRLNQRWLRNDLLPRKRELEHLLASIQSGEE